MKAPTGDDNDRTVEGYGLKPFLTVHTDGDGDGDWEGGDAAYDGDDDDEDGAAGAFSLSSPTVTSSRRVRNYVQRQHQRRQRRRCLCGGAVLVLVSVALAVSALAMMMAGGVGRRNSGGGDAGDAAAPSSPDAPPTASTDPAEASSGGTSGNSYVDDDVKASATVTYEGNDDDDDGDGDNDGTAGVAPTAFVRPDADELESYCGYSLTKSEGFDMCRSKCEHSACCRIPIGVEGSCAIERADDCQVYKAHCSVLDHKQDQQQPQSAGGTVTGPAHYGNYNRHKSAGGTPSSTSSLPYDDDHMTDDPAMQYKLIGPAPDDISLVCSRDRMSVSLDNVRACASYCVHAFCCYNRAPYDCRDVQPLCANYVDPCTNLQNKLQEP